MLFSSVEGAAIWGMHVEVWDLYKNCYTYGNLKQQYHTLGTKYPSISEY